MGLKMKIGILTGGGDCPGLNAAIRATTKAAITIGWEVVGIRDGWEGLLYNRIDILDRAKTSGIIDRGGTILGASRTSPLRIDKGPQRVFDTFGQLKLDALVVLGGDGTLTIANHFVEMGIPLVGIPKTIDNDVRETDYTIGFQTAVQIATDALDRLRSTAESHHRVMILEVMGRRTGWIATYAGIANGAEAILIPEIPMNGERLNQLCQMLETRKRRGVNFSIIVTAEGVEIEGETIFQPNLDKDSKDDPDRLGGVGQTLGKFIERGTKLRARVSSLGYIQRGGTPVAYDRSLATALGVEAIELIGAKKYGCIATLKGNRIMSVPLEKVAGEIKVVDPSIYKDTSVFFS